MSNSLKTLDAILLLIIILVMAGLGIVMPAASVFYLWLLYVLFMTLFVLFAGHAITGHFWLGWLENEQNRYSLSRLQMFLWTIVVFSAWLSCAVANLRAGHFDTALNIGINEEVWLAMGIATVSLVGSPLIISSKNDAAKKNGKSKKALPKAAKPSLFDLIRGEQEGNADLLDLSRLQNLFLTLILVGAYAVNIGGMLLTAQQEIASTAIAAFPALSLGATLLLGISHAGYLGSKSVDRPR